MKYIQARYTVQAGKLEEVKKAIGVFVAAVQKHEPRTVYMVFREGDTPTFVHLMSFENEAAERRHATSDYVDAFVKKLYPLCVGRPEFSDLGSVAGNRRRKASAGSGRRARARKV